MINELILKYIVSLVVCPLLFIFVHYWKKRVVSGDKYFLEGLAITIPALIVNYDGILQINLKSVTTFLFSLLLSMQLLWVALIFHIGAIYFHSTRTLLCAKVLIVIGFCSPYAFILLMLLLGVVVGEY